MKIILVSKCFLNIEQYVEFKMSVLISPSKSLSACVGSHLFIEFTTHVVKELLLHKGSIKLVNIVLSPVLFQWRSRLLGKKRDPSLRNVQSPTLNRAWRITKFLFFLQSVFRFPRCDFLLLLIVFTTLL